MTPTFVDPLIGKRARQFELVHIESGAVLASRVESALDFWGWLRGLRDREPPADDSAFIIAPTRALHTLFARFPVDAVFVSRDGTIVKTCRGVRPWRVTGAARSYAAVAGAPGFIDRSHMAPGDRVALREAHATRPPREVAPPWPMAESVAAGEVDEDPWGLRDTVPSQPAAARPVDLAASPAHAVAPPAGSAAADADLERLLARHTPIAWFEAVAVVQELCGALVERGTNVEGSVPGLGEIAISPGGGLTLLAEGPPAPSPVSSVAHILMALLSEAETLPVQLRLLALGAASPTPRFKSIAELSNSLAFFERPGRRAHLQALYDRFQETPVSKAEAEPTRAPPRPLVPPPSPPRPRWWTPRRIRAGVAVAAVVLAVGTANWLWPRLRGRDATGRRGPVASALAGASQRMARVAEDGVRAVARTLGLAATDRPGAVAAAEPAPPDAGEGAAGARIGRPQPAQPAATGEGGGAPSEAAPALADAAVYSARDANVTPPRLDRSRLPASPPPAGSWTEVPEDTNVTPPRLGRSRLPASPPPGVNLDDVPEIDLVVSATGEVESIRLLTQPVRVPAE